VGTLEDSTERYLLSHLPLVPRIVIAAYLISVGIGYFSALVQLHFQQASAGQILPGPDEVKCAYCGREGMGALERLIVTDEHKPFNGSGSMRPAFTFKSSGWARELRKRTADNGGDPVAAEKELRKERYLEADSIVAWIRAGAKEADFNQFVLPEDLVNRLPEKEEDGKKVKAPDGQFFTQDDKKHWCALVSAIIDTRCARCHAPGKGGSAGRIHLDEYQNVMDYITPENGKGMTLEKLAQSTHVHLLGFAMLYGLTGLIFSFTSFPLAVRLLLAPLPLVFQVVEISFWWLARVDPVFAYGIMGTGGVVAMGLGAQIVLSLFDMFGKRGRLVLAGLVVAGGIVAGAVYVQVIAPHLAAQRVTVPEQTSKE
jgi:hypothetical protein